MAAGWAASAVVGSSGPLMPSARSGSAWPLDCRCALQVPRCHGGHNREMMQSSSWLLCGSQLHGERRHEGLDDRARRDQAPLSSSPPLVSRTRFACP